MTRQSARAGSARPAPTPGTEDRDVQEFFDNFGRSLTAGDAGSVATMWAVPAYVISDSGAQVVNTSQEVEQFFAGAKNEYNARGITDTRAEIFGLEWVTDRIVLVDVRWPYLDGQGAEVGGEASTYTLRRDDNGDLKLHIAIMRGEER